MTNTSPTLMHKLRESVDSGNEAHHAEVVRRRQERAKLAQMKKTRQVANVDGARNGHRAFRACPQRSGAMAFRVAILTFRQSQLLLR